MEIRPNSVPVVTSLVALLLVCAGSALAEMPFYFKHGAWLCTEPGYYTEAVKAQEAISGEDEALDALKAEQLAAKRCYYLENDQITDVNAPYISVLETDGELWKITFVLQLEHRRAFLHRDLNWITFTAWTHSDNLKRLWSEG